MLCPSLPVTGRSPPENAALLIPDRGTLPESCYTQKSDLPETAIR